MLARGRWWDTQHIIGFCWYSPQVSTYPLRCPLHVSSHLRTSHDGRLHHGDWQSGKAACPPLRAHR